MSNLDTRLEELVSDQYNAKDNLLDDSYEEFKKRYRDAKLDFEKSLKIDQNVASINSHNSLFRTSVILIIPMNILVYLRS